MILISPFFTNTNCKLLVYLDTVSSVITDYDCKCFTLFNTPRFAPLTSIVLGPEKGLIITLLP